MKGGEKMLLEGNRMAVVEERNRMRVEAMVAKSE
ncbi:hypothetical protein A2U01_0118261, partial [Trifolium medium]|nr:hypothetical protein [Trifolium medium]